MSWGDDEDKTTPLVVPEVVALVARPSNGAPLKAAEKARNWWVRRRDTILRRNIKRLEASSAGDEYDDDEAVAWTEGKREVSAEEIKRHGTIEAAMKWKRTALDSRRSKRFSPVYMENAKALVNAIIKDKAAEKDAAQTEYQRPIKVYVNNMTVNQSQPSYEEIVLEDDE